MFIDSHAHLDGKQFDNDRDAALLRAGQEGVDTILAIGNGTGPHSLDCGLKLTEFSKRKVSFWKDNNHFSTEYPEIYATTGIHPHEAALATEDAFEEMERLVKHPKIIAWGEIGLDYFYDHSVRDVQQQAFVKQMELAHQAKLPIVIHCRPSESSENAWEDCLRLLRQHWGPSGLGGILHCFTGTWAYAKRALDLNFMISFAGNITFPKAQQIRDAALQVPLEQMLMETDSPYLAPVPHRGKRNEPAFVIEVARQLAELRRLSAEEIGAETSENFRRFFSLHEKPGSI